MTGFWKAGLALFALVLLVIALWSRAPDARHTQPAMVGQATVQGPGDRVDTLGSQQALAPHFAVKVQQKSTTKTQDTKRLRAEVRKAGCLRPAIAGPGFS